MYFGMRLRDRGDEASPDPEIAALLDYAKSPYLTLPYPTLPCLIVILLLYSVRRSVVKSLGINQGPSHMEVMSCFVTSRGTDGQEVKEFRPCLVEVGARCHGVCINPRPLDDSRSHSVSLSRARAPGCPWRRSASGTRSWM